MLNLLGEIKSSNSEEHHTLIKNIDKLTCVIDSHNGRLRKVEEWQNKMIGAIAIIGLVVTGLIFPSIIKISASIMASAKTMEGSQ